MKRFITLAILVLLCASCDRVQKTATDTYIIPADIKTLLVQTVNGGIDILSIEESGSVADGQVTVEKHAWGLSDEHAQWVLDNIRVDTGNCPGGTGSSCAIIVTLPPGASAGAHLTLSNVQPEKVTLKTTNGDVSCPAVADGDIETTNGSVTVQDASGPLLITTSNGTIEIVDYSGSTLSATTENAAIDCRISSTKIENAAFETTNGKIKLYLPEMLPCVVVLSTANGDIDFDGVEPDETQIGDDFIHGISHLKETFYRNYSGAGAGKILAQTTNSSIDVDLY